MLQELEDNRLEVAKLPTGTGWVRIPVSVNCIWYQQLCNNHLTTRKKYPKLRTFIKRKNTVLALKRMLKGNFKGIYAERILEIVETL